MSQAPILQSAALLRARNATAPRRAAPAADFASTLAAAQQTQTVKGPMIPGRPATAATRVQPTAAPSVSGPIPFKDLIESAARKYGVEPAMLAGLVAQE